MKAYKEWLNEGGRDLSSPVSIEIEAGEVKVYADPQAENWLGETVRMELYEKLLSDMKAALKDEDDTELRELLKTARDLPLFGQDKSDVWRMAQIDGAEKFRSEAEYRRWLTRYAIKKIEQFIDWSRNN